MIDFKQTEQAATAEGAKLRAWYVSHTFWGPVAVGAILWQIIRAVIVLALHVDLPG